MKTKTVLNILASAAIASFAAPSFGGVHAACEASKPTAASYTWNFKQEANNLIQTVEDDAQAAREQAATLQSFSDNQTLGWQEHAFYLSQLRDEVNDMGAKLCRLETIRSAVSPWQQTVIDKVEAELHLMAAHTQKAIDFGNNNRERLWAPSYQAHVDNIYEEARALTNTLDNAIHYAHAQKQYHHLRQDLGVHAAS